jgi:RsiW-degrading membrane proteinase PrsW (M82 family)
MALPARLKRQSTLTALGACLFIGGVALLFFTIYHDASRAGPLPWLAGALLIGTVACWAASARAGKESA